jgi:hypothetical protein
MIKNATKKRTASGISAPNKLSNIRATPVSMVPYRG